MQPTTYLAFLLLLCSTAAVSSAAPAPPGADRLPPSTWAVGVAEADVRVIRWDDDGKVVDPDSRRGELLMADGRGRRGAASEAENASPEPVARPSQGNGSRRQRAERPSIGSPTQGEGASPAKPGVVPPPLPNATQNVPSNAPVTSPGAESAVEAAARNEAEVAAARARAEEMQAYSEAHIQDLAAAAKDFEAKMKSATTPEERRALQQDYLALQRAKQEEFQRKMLELKNR